MILIHTALFSEAKPLINHFNLKQFDTKPYKIFKNKDIILIVSGIGKDNTIDALNLVLNKYQFDKVFNIGTAGCSNQTITIGELFCTNQKLDEIKYYKLETVQLAKNIIEQDDCLYDMEAKYFIEICEKYLPKKSIFVLKIVSDYCDDKILSKDIVYNLIDKSIKQWSYLINGYK